VNGLRPAASVTHRQAGVHHFALRLGTGDLAEITLLPDGFDGGNVYAEVVSELAAGQQFATKHIGPPKYEEFCVRVGPMSEGLFGWIAGSWGPQPKKIDGAVLILDHAFDIKTEVRFAGALVTETTIPALDASSMDTGYLTVKIRSEFIERKAGSGKLSLFGAKQKLWRTSNFGLAIDGLDCTKVSKIDSFTVKRAVTIAPEPEGPALVSGIVEVPNLTITFSQAAAQTWIDWHEDFVVNGNNGDDSERSGTLSFLTTDLKKELSRIDLHHLGIIRLWPAKVLQSSQIARITAELYCEEMLLSQAGASP
jgi:hypothetical protein